MRLINVARTSCFLVVLFYSLGSVANAKDYLVDANIFQEGAHWVWSYSEFNDEIGDWDRPYLYEQYRVTNRQGSKVTIEMASSDSTPNKSTSPHHRFTVDLDRCYRLGATTPGLRSLRIHFEQYHNNQWTSVSKSHKGLAFTEKFNCYFGKKSLQRDSVQIDDSIIPIMQVPRHITNSWYGTQLFTGIAVKRISRNYRMLLVKDGKSLTLLQQN